MKDMIQNKNIHCAKAFLKYHVNHLSTDSFLRSEQNIMIRPSNKNKKICDGLSLIDNEILKQELNSCLQEPLDVDKLVIENDNDFKMKTKETKNVPTTIKKVLRPKNENTFNNTINVDDSNEPGVNEIIEIRCTQKQCDNHYTSETLKMNTEIIIKAQNEPEQTAQDKLLFSDDLKSDLQSLLIMMAMSSPSTKDKEKSIPDIKKIKTSPRNEDHIKGQNMKLESLEQLNSGSEMFSLLKIEPLKATTPRENRILRKYAHKWMDYVKTRRKNIIQEQRLATIGTFFDKLEKRKLSMNHADGAMNKAKTQVRDYNTYQHRYKMQKHIIALQKAKLEQQNRLIEELKYNKIIKDSQQSLDHMKEDVRQTYYEIDKHLKPKIKCLTNELKIRDIEDTSLVLHCLKVPQFLQRMEARAREREEKHAMIRERRKQIEEERIRLKQQAELAKAEMDKEEKIMRIKELREKRKKEKIESIRKKQHAERLRALIVMADLHYEKTLTVKYGIRPLKLLIEIKRDNIEKAKAHHHFQLKKNLFLNWMWYTEDMWYERNFKANDFYRKKLLKMTFESLKKNHNEYLLKMQVAKDYYDLYVTQLVFKKFQEGILVIKKEFNIKWNTAIVYFNSNLLFKTLTCWRTLPALNALKREQDARKLRWREKVLQVVPDYVPPED